MMYSVTDVAGLNRISRRVLGNAAHAVAGMVAHPVPPDPGHRPAVGLTMFGVTTPCVTRVSELLERRLRLPGVPRHRHRRPGDGEAGRRRADHRRAGHHHHRGVRPADGRRLARGGGRFDAIARTRVPYVGSCGALDMVNFGARDTVPERYRDRILYVHNPQVTLMRTTPEENERIGALDRRQAQPLRRPGPVPDPRGRRLRDRRAGAAVPRPRGGRGAVRGAGARVPPGPGPAADPRCRSTSTTRRSPTRWSAFRRDQLTQIDPDQRGWRHAQARRSCSSSSTDGRPRASRSSAAGPVPACRPSARRPAAST